MGSITAANTTFLIAIPGLYDVPQQLQGFAADDIFGTDAIAPSEVLQGVDGRLSGGFVYNPVPQSITLQADSASNDLFDQWNSVMRASLDTFVAQGTVLWPSLGRKWTLTKGFLTSYKPTPNAGKLLQPRQHQITWESVVPAPI